MRLDHLLSKEKSRKGRSHHCLIFGVLGSAGPEAWIWGCSSVGRAPALQAGGQEFESPYLHLIIQKALNYHQYLENYTLKKIEDIDCQKTIKDINFTDLKNLFFRTRTKKYDYFVIMHSSLKNRAGVLSLMHWNKRSSE